MFYTKSFSIITLLLISNTVFAAQPEATKTAPVYFKYLSMSYEKQVPTQGYILDLKNVAKTIIPEFLHNDFKLVMPGGGSYHSSQYSIGNDADDAPYTTKYIRNQGRGVIIVLTEEGWRKYRLHMTTLQPKTEPIVTQPESWYKRSSKSEYFVEKYKRLIATTKPADSNAYAFIKDQKLKKWEFDKILSEMSDTKPSLVINSMFKKAAKDDYLYTDMLFTLFLPANIRAIAALQKINGHDDPYEYKTIPNSIDPLLGKVVIKSSGAEIDMTIYRFLNGILQEIDDIDKANLIKQPIDENEGSYVYNILNTLDKQLDTALPME